MAIPTSTLSVCTVTGTFLTLDGTPIKDLKVVFEADQKNGVVQSPAAKTTFPTFETFGVTNDSGVLESYRTESDGSQTKITGVELVFPDDDDLTQKGWNYTVTFAEDADNTSTRLSFKAVEGTVDLSSATEVTSPIYTPYLQDSGVWTQCTQYSDNWPIEPFQYSPTVNFRPLSVCKQGRIVTIDGNISSNTSMGNVNIARLPDSSFYPAGGLSPVISFVDKTDNTIYPADIDNAGYITPRHTSAFDATSRNLIFFGSWITD